MTVSVTDTGGDVVRSTVSSAANAVVVLPGSEVTRVALAELATGSSFRESGVNEEHVQLLVGLGGAWPPILARRADRVVVDGMHRVVAARRLGLERIATEWFDGGPDDALVEFIRRNVCHGLPLTLWERKRATARVLRAHPDWSDRRVAELCAISPKTVATVRRAAREARPTAVLPQLNAGSRIGRDHRARPLDRAEMRARVVEAIEARPEASLRTLAAAVGVSPETVRLVRRRLRSEAAADTLPADDTLPAWEQDAALASCEGDFVDWFDRTSIGEQDCVERVDALPLGRIYEVADEARRRSEMWMRFARRAEARATAKRR